MTENRLPNQAGKSLLGQPYSPCPFQVGVGGHLHKIRAMILGR
jgi:hypothetical protein